MSESDLIEAAATAAGWAWWRNKHGAIQVVSPEKDCHVCCLGWDQFSRQTGERLPEPRFADALLEIGWCPLDDDGDNARLRRALRIVVQWFPTDVAAMHWGEEGRGRSWPEPYGDDPAAAERRAVVRAAAALAPAAQMSHTPEATAGNAQ
jgi:hypothetical protein